MVNYWATDRNQKENAMSDCTKMFVALAVAFAAAAVPATTYYLDSEGGNDANDGVTPATAWQTLAKANDLKPQPGDKILFNQLNGHEFEQTSGDGEGQGSLACCSPWSRR